MTTKDLKEVGGSKRICRMSFWKISKNKKHLTINSQSVKPVSNIKRNHVFAHKPINRCQLTENFMRERNRKSKKRWCFSFIFINRYTTCIRLVELNPLQKCINCNTFTHTLTHTLDRYKINKSIWKSVNSRFSQIKMFFCFAV